MNDIQQVPVETKLLFTEEEWNEGLPLLTREMMVYLRSFRTLIFKDKGEYGRGYGTGSFVESGDSKYILTNQHVANVRHIGDVLGFTLAEQDKLLRVVGDHVEKGPPWDLALLPVSETAWADISHASKCISIDQIALAHTPVSGEIFAFSGFAGERSAFHFGTLLSEATCSLQREVELPFGDSKWDARFHFGLEYRPDLAMSVEGTNGLPLPPGLSGSTVWNTCLVEARMLGHPWTPSLAKVSGVVWGWDTANGLLAATRAEHVRRFILAAPLVLADAHARSAV